MDLEQGPSLPNINSDNSNHIPEAESIDVDENSRSQNDGVHLNEPNQFQQRSQYTLYLIKSAQCLFNSTKACMYGMKIFFCHNKITTFITLQLIFIFLRLSRIISEKTLFWLIIVPMFLILIVSIFYLCIRTQRHSRQLRLYRQQQQEEYLRQQYFPHRLLHNHRRPRALEQIHQLMMEQMILNSSVNNRLDFFITAGPAGRRIRALQLEPNIHNLNGTRMQIRLISRGLFRLLAEFIEEQQLQQNRNNQRNGLTEEQINNLPLERYTLTLTGAEGAETCSICIDEFKEEQELRKLPCNHRFHKTCIDEWLKISNSCPNCKAEVITNGEQPPFSQEP